MRSLSLNYWQFEELDTFGHTLPIKGEMLKLIIVLA